MIKLASLFTIIALIAAIGCQSARSGNAPGTSLTDQQKSTLTAAISYMKTHGVNDDAVLGQSLLNRGIWRSADPDDIYIAQAEKAGDTPFAYTLSPGKKPVAIVLAARFFDETTLPGRAALMVHEMGHYKAYVKNGRSDEYDGYKEEYDNHTKLSLTDKDGLVYFAMLDGTAEYVVPRDKSYAKRPDLQQFLTN